VGLLALSGALAGCTSTPKKKSPPPANTRPGAAQTPFWASGGSRQPGPASLPGRAGTGGNIDPVSAPGNDPEVSGILAGRLVDSFGRPPASAFIQVLAVGAASSEAIEVETVNQGHFYIRGLQPGRTYRLVARAQRDGRLIAGEAQARPPETRLLLTLSEDFVTSTTPQVPGAPPGLNPARPRPVASPQSATRPPAGAPTVAVPAVDLGAPAAAGPELSPVSPARPDQFAETAHPRPPTASVPGPLGPAPGTPGAFAPAPAGPVAVVAQNRVQYLALPDADGRPWDFTQRRGRLVLFDFWGTWCGPCLRAIPDLVRLQSSYGPRGLEVVGIACEKGTPADAARRVQDIRRKIPGVNYRMLLSDDATRGAVQSQFRIDRFPTLILVDADGTVLWRGGPEDAPHLEQILRRRLAY
jgi:thiol-disulfide isomerase/thioredoxin